MNPTERYTRLFEHDAWANDELARALHDAVRAEDAGMHALERSVRILAHLFAAEWLWLRRLGRRTPSAAVWPAWDSAESRQQVQALRDAWRELLDGLEPAGLARAISYTNSKGEPWTSTTGEVLDHVLLHSSHHRGQVVANLRAAGREPPLVDYIHATRSGIL